MTLSKLLKGEKVHLTALDKADAKVLLPFYSDPQFLRNLDAVPAMPHTMSNIESRIEEENKSNTAYMFGIRLLDSNELIGYCALSGILWTHGSGWLEIGLGANHQGKGYGTEAMRLLIDFGFRELNLYRIQLSVFEYNIHAIQLYEKLGFTNEGAARQALNRDGQRYDMRFYGLLRHEWDQ